MPTSSHPAPATTITMTQSIRIQQVCLTHPSLRPSPFFFLSANHSLSSIPNSTLSYHPPLNHVSSLLLPSTTNLNRSYSFNTPHYAKKSLLPHDLVQQSQTPNQESIRWFRFHSPAPDTERRCRYLDSRCDAAHARAGSHGEIPSRLALRALIWK
jgi:hypothetical protein